MSNLKEFQTDLKSLIASIKTDLARGEQTDLTIGAEVTADNEITWNYQTGDNSYTGGAYGFPHWALITVDKRTNKREAARDIIEQLEEVWDLKPTFADLLTYCRQQAKINPDDYAGSISTLREDQQKRNKQRARLLNLFDHLPESVILPPGKSTNGRLEVTGNSVHYTAGQYTPTEIWDAATDYLSSVFERAKLTRYLRLPSVKNLENTFPGCGRELRKCMENVNYAEIVSDHWIGSCHHRPSNIEIILNSCDLIAETCGVEYIGTRKDTYTESYGVSYLNAGDTYVSTLIYDHARDSFRISSYGDVVESRPNLYV